MSELAILVPVLRRPHRVAPLLESIAQSTPAPHRVVFICDPGDKAERRAVAGSDAEVLLVSGGYAVKINTGARVCDEQLLFLAADDLQFQPGWLEAASARFTATVQVVGVNDGLRRHREHATHFLMTRRYAELGTIDGQDGPLFEGYHHWRCDDELIATAKIRHAYAYAPDSRVDHLHYMNGRAEMDDTYRKGAARIRQDNALFGQREPLWS